MNHDRSRSLVLFNYDWDQRAFAELAQRWPHRSAGFDLFSFPSNARLAWFDMQRFVALWAHLAPRLGLTAVLSNHEQFGALAAALLAERMGWPGTPVNAVLACQHKLYAREVLQRVCPEVNPMFQRLDARYGGPVPQDLPYPLFIKPVKAAFSVLARSVHSHAELHAHTRFGTRELWVIRHLVEPFERIMRERLPQAGTAHSLMVEGLVDAPQYCLDGYVQNGELHRLGLVDVAMYPGTQAFMRFDYPSQLAQAVVERATDVARRFLREIGFTHGLFNMEFFHDPQTDRITVIEFNPRLASQFSDLYRRVDGIDLHELALALAHGRDPAALARVRPTAGAASSFVYRLFDPRRTAPQPGRVQRKVFHQAYPDALLMAFPRAGGAVSRDFKWLGSYRYGIIHLGGADPQDLRRRCEVASSLVGWTPPYADLHAHLHADPCADPQIDLHAGPHAGPYADPLTRVALNRREPSAPIEDHTSISRHSTHIQEIP